MRCETSQSVNRVTINRKQYSCIISPWWHYWKEICHHWKGTRYCVMMGTLSLWNVGTHTSHNLFIGLFLSLTPALGVLTFLFFVFFFQVQVQVLSNGFDHCCWSAFHTNFPQCVIWEKIYCCNDCIVSVCVLFVHLQTFFDTDVGVNLQSDDSCQSDRWTVTNRNMNYLLSTPPGKRKKEAKKNNICSYCFYFCFYF